MANIISFYDCVAHVNLVLSAGTGCARENNKRQRLTSCKSSAIITSFYNCVSSPRQPAPSDLVTITLTRAVQFRTAPTSRDHIHIHKNRIKI